MDLSTPCKMLSHLDYLMEYKETASPMISPDYFDFRWSWYTPVLNRQEKPAEHCVVEVRRLPIHMAGRDAGEYIPFAVQTDVENALKVSLRRLQDYAIRYMVRGEKVSAHTLPPMDAKVRAMVAYLRKQNPHISRDLLHHWCAEPQGAAALLNVCEVLWEQGWKQDQADAAPWVPAVNVLLLRLIRTAIASLSEEESATTNHVMLCVVGGLYIWALQEFLKRYLEGVVEVARISNYEAMMLPVTPMVFLRHQPASTLLADDSRLIRTYGLEPEIVPQLRYLSVKVGARNDGGILSLLARDKMGAHLLRRTWARLSLWKLAMKTGHGGWMRWVLDAKRLDQLLAGQVKLDGAALANLQANSDEPIAVWLLAQLQGSRAVKNSDEPWLRDRITLMAFRVFEEDVRVEIARRKAERSWMDCKADLAAPGKQRTGLVGISEVRAQAGLRGGRNVDGEKRLIEAWQEGELVLIQSDVTKALHSGRTLSLRHGCLRVEWSDYLARICTLTGFKTARFLDDRFMPNFFAIVESRDDLFLDECSGSGCMLRGSILSLVDAALQLREQLRLLYLDVAGETDEVAGTDNLPVVTMCMDMTGEWAFSEMKHSKSGSHRIVFSLAVSQVEAGIARDAGVAHMMRARDEMLNQRPIGSVNVESINTGSGESVQIFYNAGIALTASAMKELTGALRNKAKIHEYRPTASQVEGVLDGFSLPLCGLELVAIQRSGDKGEAPLLLMKAGRPNLGGVDVDLYELLDEHTDAARRIVEQGMARWR